MTKALLAAVALGLSVAGANACDFMRSAATHTDNMSVASTTATQSKSTSDTRSRTDAVRTDQVKDDAVPPDGQG